MAITRADCLIWEALGARGKLPAAPSLLEIGQANWYGDTPLSWLGGKVSERRPELRPALAAAADAKDYFAIAEIFYSALLDVREVEAIDLNPPEVDRRILSGPRARELDLNEPISLGRQFAVVVNTGTVEHVFDQRRALQTIHEHCKVGGLMLHAGPLGGWPDHGFFHAQPCLWVDLARANGYAVEFVAYFDRHANTVAEVDRLETLRRGKWADGSMLYVVLRRTQGDGFRVPIQGVYSGADDATHADWRALR